MTTYHICTKDTYDDFSHERNCIRIKEYQYLDCNLGLGCIEPAFGYFSYTDTTTDDKTMWPSILSSKTLLMDPSPELLVFLKLSGQYVREADEKYINDSVFYSLCSNRWTKILYLIKRFFRIS